MRRLAYRAIPLLCCLAALPGGTRAAAVEPSEGVQLTYLGNEGFLIEAGETRVLIDALFGDGLSGYPAVPPVVRADLEGARGLFADVDLIFASHAHADHFDPAAVARHLRANPGAIFLSTAQAVASLREELGEQAAALDAVAANPDEGKSVSLELAGLTVRVLNLHHGRLPIDNLGLIVRLGGLGVLHVGDTSAGRVELRLYGDLLEGVDVWLLPDWLLGEAAWEAVRPAGSRLVAMHLAAPTAPAAWFGSAGSLEQRVIRIREAHPNVWVPLAPLASRHYPPRDP